MNRPHPSLLQRGSSRAVLAVPGLRPPLADEIVYAIPRPAGDDRARRGDRPRPGRIVYKYREGAVPR